MQDERTSVRSRHTGAKAIWSWAFYDFANSPFSTLVVTFVYATYFTQYVAADPVSGTALWSRAVTATALVVALTSPIFGAFADRVGYRKPFLIIFSAVAIIGCAALYTVTPGQVVLALLIFAVANTCFELACVMYNATLPDIAPSNRIGLISGLGWGLGYLGGLLALALALVTLVQPETPWFGFSKEAGENIRATNLLVAAWYIVFSLPLFLWVREERTRPVAGANLLKSTFRQIGSTFQEVRKYRQIVRLLVARLFYNDGLVTLFAFGGIYAAGTFGFTVEEVLVFGIVLNVAAGLGSFAMGFLDDLIGGKRTVQCSLVGLSLATSIVVVAPDKTWFWVGAILIGIFVGPNQSASRSLMGRLVPADKQNEFFGFFAFSGKATAFMGPLFLGVLTEFYGTQRAGVVVVLVLFVLGLIVLGGIDEDDGISVGHRTSA